MQRGLRSAWRAAGLFVLSSAACAAEDVVQAPEVLVTAPYMTPGLNLDKPAEAGSRLGITVQETPASVEVLPGETIRIRGDFTAQSAVQRATGIVAAGSPGDGTSAVAARGFYGPDSIMQLYDGIRVYAGAQTVTFPADTWVLDRVEVLRGPASVLYGEGSIGGAINFVPRQPERNARFVDLLAAGGSESTYRLGGAATGPISDKAAYQVAVIGTRSGGWVDRGDSERASFASSLVFDVTNELTLKLSFDGAYNKPEQYFGIPLVNGAIDERLREINYNVQDSEIRYEDYWTRLRADWRISPSMRLSNDTYLLTADRHWRNAEAFSFNPATSQVDRQFYIEILHDQRQEGNRLALNVDSDLAGLKNRFVVGLEINQIRFRRTSNSPFSGASTVDAFNPAPGVFLNVDPTVSEFDTRTKQHALFAEDYIDLTAAFKLTGGLRYEKIDLEQTSLTSGSSFSKNFTPTTWRIGSIYALNPKTSLYGQISEGVDPISSLITISPAERDLSLAKARQYEVGVKGSFLEGRGEATLAAYHIVKKNLLTQDPNSPATTIQVGKQSSRGLEVAVSAVVARGLTLDANATILSAEFGEFHETVDSVAVSRKGNQPKNVHERAANLWVLHAPLQQWRWGAGARYVGERFADNANTIRMPAYTVFDAFASYAPTTAFTMTLRGRNLLDKTYATVGYYTGTQVILGEPRSFELAAEMRF